MFKTVYPGSFLVCLDASRQTAFFTPERKLLYFEPRTNTKVWILWRSYWFQLKMYYTMWIQENKSSLRHDNPLSWRKTAEKLALLWLHWKMCPKWSTFCKIAENVSKLIHFLQYFGKCSNLSTFWNILKNVRRGRLELLKQNVVNISITNWYTGFDIWKKYKNWHFGKYIKFVFVLYYFVKYVHIHPIFLILWKMCPNWSTSDNILENVSNLIYFLL